MLFDISHHRMACIDIWLSTRRKTMSDRDRFDKFTERARRVLSLAQEEAQRFQHNYIGTEHLLLGLVREGDGVAARVLNNLGVELHEVRRAVEFIIGRGDRIVLGEIGLTPRAKKVIELAVDEARRLNHHYIGTEHLLLGLVREGEGIAAGVLESLGVNLEKVRTQTIQVLNQTGSGNPGDTSPKHSKTPTIDQMGINLTAQAPLNLKEAMRELDAVLRKKDEAIQNQDYAQAAALHDREVQLKERIAKLESGRYTGSTSGLGVERLTHIQAEMQQTFGIGDRDPSESLGAAQSRAYSLARSISELLAEIARLQQQIRSLGE